VDTDATTDQRALLDVSTRFMEDACPLQAVREGAWKEADRAAAYRRQAAELGWFSMLVPESLGGGSVSGDGTVDAALIAYHRGAHLQPGSFVGTNVVAFALATAGSDEAREKILPALIAGEAPASWVAPPGDRASNVTGRVLDDGGLELSGTAHAVQDVEASSWLLVTCSTEAGSAQAVVAADAPGVTVLEQDGLDLSRRFADVRFEDLRVPAAAVVGEPGASGDLIERQLAIACVLLTAETVGAMDQDFGATVQYAKDRIAFGRPIGSFQGVKHQLADTAMLLEMSKAITVAAARTVGAGDDYGPQSASMAKAFVAEAGIDLVQTCFQVYGGIGYTWEHDQHLYLRRITTDAGLLGDAAWHREHLCQLAGL
jgi:alkylation response protein AidB-like acyl-CoA dehydrogenase